MQLFLRDQLSKLGYRDCTINILDVTTAQFLYARDKAFGAGNKQVLHNGETAFLREELSLTKKTKINFTNNLLHSAISSPRRQ